MGAGGNFFARTIDANVKETVEILKAADQHKGTAIVEVLQNCVIFNNGAHQRITDKEERENNQLWLEHGKPMIFGKDRNKGLVLDGLKLKVVTIGENGITEKDILVHDMYEEDLTLHTMLVNLNLPDFPVVFGIVRAVKAATYNDLLYEQIAEVQSKSSIKGMDDVFNSGSTWEV